jgi:hypothetical protein
MKKFLLAVSLLITLPTLAAEPNVKLIVSKIDLAPLKSTLKLKDKEQLAPNIIQYWFDFFVDKKLKLAMVILN